MFSTLVESHASLLFPIRYSVRGFTFCSAHTKLVSVLHKQFQHFGRPRAHITNPPATIFLSQHAFPIDHPQKTQLHSPRVKKVFVVITMSAKPQTKTFGKTKREVPSSADKAKKWYNPDDDRSAKDVSFTIAGGCFFLF